MREAAGLTKQQLAGIAGCSLAWLSNAESGYIPKRSPTLERVLKVLNDNGAPGESAEVKAAGQAGPTHGT